MLHISLRYYYHLEEREELGINQDHIIEKMVIPETTLDLGSFKHRLGVQGKDLEDDWRHFHWWTVYDGG